MTEERELQPGLIVAGRYRVEKRLGAGGMGSVYLVQHVHTEERLALKVLHKAVIADTSSLERFRREARTPAKIDSEYVVRVTDADAAEELGGAPFLVMEYLRGQDIDQRLEAGGPFSPATTVHLLRQAARALDKAHSLGIVHRDLKPENLFVVEREDGSLVTKILDFGIAKFTTNPDDVKISAATRPGAVFGTPLFMSPEQAIDSSKVSSATDVWALGLIAHRMLTGQDYWTAETLTSLIAQIAYEPMVPPSERGATLGPAYDAWFLKCCARPPEERFATASDAVRALATALGVSVDLGPTSSLRAPGGDLPRAVPARTDAAALSDTQLATTRRSTGEPRGVGGKLGVAVAVLAIGGVGAFLLANPGGGEPSPEGARGAGASTARAAAATPRRDATAPAVTASAARPVVAPVASASAEPAGVVEPIASASSPAGGEQGAGEPGAGAAPPVPAGPSASAAAGAPPRPPTPPAPPRPPSTPEPPRPPATPAAPAPPAPPGSDPFGSRF